MASYTAKDITVLVAILVWTIPIGNARSPEGQLSYPQGWVQSAIDFGRAGTPAPYVLPTSSTRGGPSALLYTPFIRVALLARQAENEGRLLRIQDIPPDFLEPVVYVRFYRLIKRGPDDATEVPPVFGIVPTGQILPDGNRIEPAWVRNVDASLPEVSAGESGSEKFYPVAAFPVQAVRAGYDFVVYHKWQSATGSWVTPNLRGVIREEDLRTWR
jgi:hypothetical protein